MKQWIDIQTDEPYARLRALELPEYGKTLIQLTQYSVEYSNKIESIQSFMVDMPVVKASKPKASKPKSKKEEATIKEPEKEPEVVDPEKPAETEPQEAPEAPVTEEVNEEPKEDKPAGTAGKKAPGF